MLPRAGRIGRAIETAERLTNIAPNDIGAQRVLAQALMQVNDHGRAVIVLEEARRISPGDAGLLAELGAAYLGTGDLHRAEEALRAAVQLDDFAVAARARLGRILMSAGKMDEAAAALRSALDIIPSYGDAAFALVELEQARGQLEGGFDCTGRLAHARSVQPGRTDQAG